MNSKLQHSEYPDLVDYHNAFDALHDVACAILLSFAKNECSTKDQIIRNFIARSVTSMNGILQLWQSQNYQDCWILSRCLLDRLFHLVDLGDTDSFDSFEEWSFHQQYRAQNKVRSDSEIEYSLRTSAQFTPTHEQKKRYEGLEKNKPLWKRPKAETVAKGLDMGFLYKYGYDYGSTHVHPMASDGLQDFFRFTKLEPGTDSSDQRAVLSNSFIATIVVIQRGLNYSNFQWIALLYDALDHILAFLGTGQPDYIITVSKILQAKENASFIFCKPSSA